MTLQPARGKGWGPYSGFESFPLCYTAGRHEGAWREAKVELLDGGLASRVDLSKLTGHKTEAVYRRYAISQDEPCSVP